MANSGHVIIRMDANYVANTYANDFLYIMHIKLLQ